MEPTDRNQARPEPPEDPPPPEDDVRLSSDMERAAAIASVMRDQALKKKAMARVKPPGQKPLLPQLVALAGATVLAVYVWFGSPGWLQPDPVPPPPLQVERDATRTAVLLQVERIREYRERYGRLPAFLEEAGQPLPGVDYQRLDNRSFRVRSRTPRTTVSYQSGESLDEFRASLDAVLGNTVGP